MLPELARPVDAPDVLDRLRELCADRGLDGLAENLSTLRQLVHDDMRALEDSLSVVPRKESLVQRSAGHLLYLGGKRLRPLCVALASRVGEGFNGQGLELAVAVELVHNATLLHDDVVDLATTRRGTVTARAEFGNAASIFAGDWLLIEALRRVQRASIPGVLDRLLDTVSVMIEAESLQLENRGRLDADRELYFSIAEGKSATLFRWALYAGARAGCLGDEDSAALEDFGLHLGVAFQVIDDLLDLTGEATDTGKALFTDLREGKMTYPLILMVEREPSLRSLLEEIVTEERVGGRSDNVSSSVGRRVVAALHDTGAVRDSRDLARQRASKAVACLASLPENEATAALALVAESTVNRSR